MKDASQARARRFFRRLLAEVWGTYEHRLARTADGWKADGFTFRMTHGRGNPWVKATPGR